MRRNLLLLFAFAIVITFSFSSEGFAQTRAQHPLKYFTFRWTTEKPTIELAYGLSDMNLSGYSSDFKRPGLIELRLGYASEYPSRYSKEVLDYDNDFLFISSSTTDITAQKNSAGVSSSMWRFGFGNKEGMGLKFGSFSVMPYSSNSFAWSRLSFDKDAAALSGGNPSDYDKFDDFNKSVRFGTSTEAGINLQLTKGFSLQPKYEIADIFPRHLFGQQMLSSIIELSGAHMLDEFITKIMRNSPVAGTIVNFVLKNAYEFGFYELRKDHANWPFNGDAPLRVSSFKMGMTFTF